MDEKWFLQQADSAGQLTRLAERAQKTFWGLLGCEVVHADGHKAAICLDVTQQHLNLLDIVHGGVLMSLMDNAMGLIVMLAEADSKAVTATMNTHFLANSKGGLLLCESELMHRTGRTLTLLAQVKDEEGKLLAWGSGSYRLL
ncbi:PaaI family thioesterase [Paenibacillus sp. GSMTC-2017]|uniref:PaaI family thioesterase n=1 Tax=Paenibacillus sp. GSMTC-2017 TaxID=2794350 RepID=UPI0018D98505|nr:PaaI family thioesterase [Paenibacillus sp. GSMTC-2017]MBH5318714.1 PaaI family thioesterase [Paenibacillus sp. GSMTC-2017]